jgi:ethanolamine permease
MLMLIALAVTFTLCILNYLLRNRRTTVIEVPDHA